MPPLSLLIKPASGSCNMNCRYCFYADEAENRSTPLMGRMSSDTLHTLIDRCMDYADHECSFAFQGGEPTLAGLSFFQDLTDTIKSHPNPKKLQFRYSIQTNGYALDEGWARWFAENQVLVGISLDGPREIHDRYRRDHRGQGTFDKVMESIRLLEKYQVDFNILTVVSGANARHGKKVYDFFRRQDFRYQQYIECLDPIGVVPGMQEYSLTPARYEYFLKSIFDCWYQDMKAGRYVNIRYFENLMMIVSGQRPESCSLQGFCSPHWVIEADGSTYPCDFYALDEWKLGNILDSSFEAMEKARKESGFIEWSVRLPEKCRSCRYLSLCRNGCRRNREPVTSASTNTNYFCEAYRNFLTYASPRLKEILQLLIRSSGH